VNRREELKDKALTFLAVLMLMGASAIFGVTLVLSSWLVTR